MCGIALLYHKDGRAPERERIERMTQALHHRGPDARATLVRGAAGLGHARLSIVDVTGGAQPMLTPDARYAIVFNGEIYNYRGLRKELEQQGARFQTQSDTEVILHAYQRYRADCVARLRGMFAFAIHDAHDGSLFIARDRLGIKPLFYTWDGKTLSAASEIKALFAARLVEPRLQSESIRNYFTYQFSICPHTPFADVFELPPGHHLLLNTNDDVPRLTQYWDLEFPRADEYETQDEKYWEERLRAALEDAAASHTIGDVPIGAYLSGGIDSATTTWLMTRFYGQPLQTFSIRFANSALDESPVYRNIAAHLKIGNTELTMADDRRAGYLDDLRQCIYHLEQPQRMAVDIPHFLLSDLVRRNNYKVVYTGDGADEIFAGYDCYRHDLMRRQGNQIADAGQRNRHYLTEYTKNFSQEYVHMLLALHEPQRQQRTLGQFGCYPAWHDFWQILHDMSAELFTPDFARATQASTQMDALVAQLKPHMEGRHHLNQSLYLETKTRLPGWILWKSDRLSMAHGVEARVPFMDHALVELAARMPPHLKLNGMNEKYLLKKIAQPYLPQHPAQFKKRAFYTPIREWFFTKPRYASLEPYLCKAALQESGIFNPATVHAFWNALCAAQAPTNANEYYRVMKLEWTLMMVLTVQILHAQFVKKQAPCFQGGPPASA